MRLCDHCGYLPARDDRGGYCSWDCHDHAYVDPPGALGAAPRLRQAPGGRLRLAHGGRPCAAAGVAC